MKNISEVHISLKNELKHWFIRQTRDIYTDFYLYYTPQTHEHDSGLIICKDKPANKDYKLVQKIGKQYSADTNFTLIVGSRILNTLPILDI